MLIEKQITLDRLTIFYQIAGNSKNKPLIFLHGWGARAKDTFGRGRQNVTEKLSKYFHVYSVELPGLIRSEPPKEVWDMEDYAKAIHSFVEILGISKPILMGQSFGGGVATTYAGLYPKDVPYLILIDASPGKRKPNFYYSLRFKWKPFFHRIIDSKKVPLAIKKVAISLYLGVPLNHIANENVREYKIMSNIDTTYSVKTNYNLLSMPVLLIWGEKDTFITPLKRAKEIASEIPNARLVVIPGTGHLALYTKTDKVIDEIVKFVLK